MRAIVRRRSPSPRIVFLLSIITLLPLLGCNEGRRRITMAGGDPATPFGEVARALGECWTENGPTNVRMLSGPEHTPIFNLEQLARGEVDLALSQNDIRASSDSGGRRVRTILPLYPQILFIIAHDTIAARTLPELVRGRKVVLGPRTSGTATLMRHLLASFGVDSTQYHPVYTSYKDRILSDTVDICCALTGFDNRTITTMLTEKHGKLFSLDAYELAGRGSSVDGFCMNYRGARSFIIPKSSYGNAPEAPVLTVAVDAVLLGREELDPYLVHDLVKSLIEHQQELAQREPLFGATSEKFDQQNLDFPLHEGTTMYLERNQPSFIERYIDLIGVGFSVMVGLIGGGSALLRWNGRRKKDRIDVYYLKVLAIERSLPEIATPEECDAASASLLDLRSHAFEQLVEEKLAADESFRILMSIIDDALRGVARRKEMIAEAMGA